MMVGLSQVMNCLWMKFTLIDIVKLRFHVIEEL